MADPSSPRRRGKVLLVLVSLVVLLAVLGLELAHLAYVRRQTLDEADRRARGLAAILSEYVRGSLATIDSSLQQVSSHGERIGGPSGPAEEWAATLEGAKASLPGIGSLSVTDAAGIIRHSTLLPIVGQSRSHHYMYRELRARPRDEFILDRPLLSVTEPIQYIIPVGRPLLGPGGRFLGLVVATFTPARYREFFRTIDVGEGGIIWVFHPDGVVLFREPSTGDPINESATGHPIFAAARGGGSSGTVRSALDPGGTIYRSAFKSSGNPGMIVAVSLDEAEVLENWREEARTSGIAFVALTATLGIVLLVTLRQMRARTDAERAFAELQRLEAERLRDANERLESALQREQRARQEAEAASYMKDQFLMTVSHELRTPLTAIYGWTRMLSQSPLAPDEQARALAVVERNAQAQTRLIDDLLDMARAITGKLRIDARPVDVGAAVQAAVETVQPALDARRIHLTLDVDPATPPVPADPDRLQQIAWNLLSNAVKFSPDGATVCVRVRPAGNHVELQVQDDGAGISPEFLPYVFERFHQAEAGARRRYGGLGLGLAIVRHLVELHGGTVAAASEGEGKGATFTVRLPLTSPTSSVQT